MKWSQIKEKEFKESLSILKVSPAKKEVPSSHNCKTIHTRQPLTEREGLSKFGSYKTRTSGEFGS